MNEIINMIGSVGFPIVMCMILVYRMREQDEKHANETKQLSDAIQSNTLVMQKLCDKLGGNLK